jgi:Protein of unknown function (DUF1318)
MTARLPAAAAAALLLTACIHAPDIVLVDRATALEQQAAGSYERLEAELTSAAMQPRPAPLSPDQLEAAGHRPAPLVEEAEPTDAERIDGLLKQRCIGEALDGSLVDTHDRCPQTEDLPALLALVDRQNRERSQLWRAIAADRPQASSDDVRRAWRVVHLKHVVCGGQVQNDAGKWEAKKC